MAHLVSLVRLLGHFQTSSHLLGPARLESRHLGGTLRSSAGANLISFELIACISLGRAGVPA